MEPSLDETSLVPDEGTPPGKRIAVLAAALRALDQLGVARVLRSTSKAVDLDIAGGRGLRSWCFDRRSTDRDAGLLVAGRLARQPFIDGPQGLFASAEGDRAVEATLGGAVVHALGLAALTGEPVVALRGRARAAGAKLDVLLMSIDQEGERTATVPVLCLVSEEDVRAHGAALAGSLDRELASGAALLARAVEIFPRLKFGPKVVEQIAALTGSEPVFRQLLRHLRTLQTSAERWRAESPFAPAAALPWSVESQATLEDGRTGPLRDFPMPDGFARERWSLHTKLSGGAAARLYFMPKRTPSHGPVVLIGYFGRHLPTAGSGG